MKFGSVVRVETLRHLTKNTALWRKASKNKVLAAKHTASLQLLCAVGGSQATVDARAEFEIPERSPKGGVKLVVQQAVYNILYTTSIALIFSTVSRYRYAFRSYP